VINRAGAPISRTVWESTTSGILADPASVTVTFDSVIYNSGTRALDVYLRATFTGTVTGTLNFNCIIVEDSVVGVGSGYNQVNSYNTTPGHAYYGAGNPIVGLPHRYVARNYLGGAWGTSGIINNSVGFGDIFTHHYSTVLPASYNANRISLVGLVCRNDGSATDQRKILNAAECVSLSPPNASFTASTANICKGESVTYTNTSTDDPTAWSWTFEGGTPATSLLQSPGPVTYSIPGNHITTLVVTGATGSNTHSMNIAVDSAEIGVTQTLYSLTANAAIATYQWLDCDNNFAVIGGETGQEYVLTHTGTFAVQVTEGGCTDTSACIVVTSFGINNNQPGALFLYPNPNSGSFTLEMTDDGIIEIINQLGMPVYYSGVLQGKNDISANLAAGAYMLRVVNGTSTHNFRLMVQ